MNIDRKSGYEIMLKYLGRDPVRIKHSGCVGELAFKIAGSVMGRNPEIEIDPDLAGFLGYVHDIGYFLGTERHELNTINLLAEKENIPMDIAEMAMHGQMLEQYGVKDDAIGLYTPKGIEGIILNYSDMSVTTGKPMHMQTRVKDIVYRLRNNPDLTEEMKHDREFFLYKAVPRFSRYEKLILTLANVNSVKEF